jgi:DNA-binding NarL/FixJ family response regulator
MSSGLRDDPRVEESLAEGVKGFLQKPYLVDALVSEIERVLHGA